MKTAVFAEQTMTVRFEDADKDEKKKKRRSRRSRNNSVSGAMDETCGEASESLRNGSKVFNSLSKQPWQEDIQTPEKHGVTRTCDVAFNSMPSLRINELEGRGVSVNTENRHVSVDLGSRMLPKSCQEPLAYECLPGTCTNNDLPAFRTNKTSVRHKLFAPYWSMDAINEALENGEAFKALFRVNAHNRLEAYCKIDGVPTDILINGCASQNRAVEGDTVIIQVERPSLWTKMKGSPGNSNAQSENRQTNELIGDSHKGKDKVIDDDSTQSRRGLLHYDGGFVTGETSKDVGELGPSPKGSPSPTNEPLNAVGKLCAKLSSSPSKRPTGRVLGIIEPSPRRDTIIGFLNVKQWYDYREGCRKDTNLSKYSLSTDDHEYIQLAPTDPRFPKMMVFVRELPDTIKRRLENGDTSIETELVAAQIDEWSEESPFPQALILHNFGRGGELKSQINAILFENAVDSSDFSPESISCLPCIPWEVPQEEFKYRKDLRDLCVFTIDPSTATDLDDALSVQTLSKGIIRVGVHIADASYFVLPDTALDIEAQKRSTSVYLLQSKLPMLPPILSESLGSLNPGVDRLAFSIFWDLNDAGDVIDRWIGRSVVHSCCKLSYENVQDIIDGMVDFDSPNTSENDWPQLHGTFTWFDIIRSVKSLHEVSKVLKQKRFDNGAIRLESSKLFFLFDEYGNPQDCVLQGRIDSNFLVEEFMLLANRTAAEIISRAFPDSALLRRHPEPNRRKLKEFEAFCYKHGFDMDTTSGGFRQSLERIRDRLKDDSVLFNILINNATKPMQLASYFCTGVSKDDASDWGHYALAVPLYTHFTSPLRRYPDIIVHRTLAAAIEAEESCLKHCRTSLIVKRCFSGINFNRDAAESLECREALSAAALKHGVPHTELLAEVAAYCNERKLASRHVKDASDKLYTWIFLKKQGIVFSEARVLALGPRFMSIYIPKLAIERRINYDAVEGLTAEYLGATSVLVLHLCAYKRPSRKGIPNYHKALEDTAYVVNPYDIGVESKDKIIPGVFPLTVRILSTIPIALHAVGGDDGQLEIGVRLYMSSYLWE